VSQKRWCEHCEGGSNVPNEVVAARAHLSSGSTCGGGAAVMSHGGGALRSRVAPVVGSCSAGGEIEGEAHATCEP
jgi:hypothetical protein